MCWIIDVLLSLPKELVERAEAAGLLSEPEATAIFERELERRRSARNLIEIMHALQPAVRRQLQPVTLSEN